MYELKKEKKNLITKTVKLLTITKHQPDDDDDDTDYINEILGKEIAIFFSFFFATI